jgi:type VI secretion system ImpM family protein
MWRFLRKKKEEVAKMYSSDVIAATGKLPMQAEFIRYRITSGVTAEFDQWLQQAYREYQKDERNNPTARIPLIHFVFSAVGELQLPMTGIITGSQDSSGRHYPFSIFRILEHPLSHEFRGVIPWLYRDTFSSMQQLVMRPERDISTLELHRQLENIRFCNSRLKRRDALEAIIQQLRYMTFRHFWEAARLPYSAALFFQHTTALIRQLKQGKYLGIRLPLPNHHDVLPTVVFWMQLLETALGEKNQHWQIYWHVCHTHQRAAMIYYLGKLPPTLLTSIVNQQLSHPAIADTLHIDDQLLSDSANKKLVSESHLPMMSVLSHWGQHINV